MIIYNPHSRRMLDERLTRAEAILNKVPARYCFITGSFLHSKKYNDIDLFVVTRTKKNILFSEKKVKITRIDFNELYSLLYHAASKSCIAKNLLPERQLKVTLSDYWHVINEAVPTIMNEKKNYKKNVRFLILYTEYFKTAHVLDTFELDQKIKSFRTSQDVLTYISKEVPPVIASLRKQSYIKRFFYTQAGFYKDLTMYAAQNFLYHLTHIITRGATHG